jgi:hypothetical protein
MRAKKVCNSLKKNQNQKASVACLTKEIKRLNLTIDGLKSKMLIFFFFFHSEILNFFSTLHFTVLIFGGRGA